MCVLRCARENFDTGLQYLQFASKYGILPEFYDSNQDGGKGS